jgi:hypothetical protein
VNFLSRMGFVGHVVSFVIAGLILVIACIFFIRGFSIARNEKVSGRTMAGCITAILAAATVIGATSFPSSASPSSRSTVRHKLASHIKGAPLAFQIPHPAYSGNPLPTVSCMQQLSIAGHIPAGDVLVTANEVAGSSGYYFVSVDQADNSNNTEWTVTVDFGRTQDGGKAFHLVAFALPSFWVSYLNHLYAGLGGRGGGWDSGTLPPEAAELSREDVRRNKDTCPNG